MLSSSEVTFESISKMKSNIENLLLADHPMQAKKVTWPRTQLKSHFDSVRDL